ncbi:mitochondrial import inner membrane translocase [Striga asiatica]|uniref:Mitochondrial import inner membrane translocase n=1 Tax=Striga asiatica TaxID=4170 RepID=A0A5A7PIB1_STRAF|nr:mitochondrial import inner membrane translocase [Striga asiatica]
MGDLVDLRPLFDQFSYGPFWTVLAFGPALFPCWVKTKIKNILSLLHNTSQICFFASPHTLQAPASSPSSVSALPTPYNVEGLTSPSREEFICMHNFWNWNRIDWNGAKNGRRLTSPEHNLRVQPLGYQNFIKLAGPFGAAWSVSYFHYVFLLVASVRKLTLEFWVGSFSAVYEAQSRGAIAHVQAEVVCFKHQLVIQFFFLAMAAKILANLIIMGSGIMARALVQAYRQALANASKNGVAQEAAHHIKRGSKMMTEAEARQILGVSENSTWEEIVQRTHAPSAFTPRERVELLHTAGAPSMIICLNGMRKMGVFISNQRFIEPKSVWKPFTNRKSTTRVERMVFVVYSLSRTCLA